jgi:hypothetical protein
MYKIKHNKILNKTAGGKARSGGAIKARKGGD